jgi:hypothetical protein
MRSAKPLGTTAPEIVRLKVAYRSPETLLGEFTRSIGRGGVALESKKSLAVGTKFIFELWVKGVSRPVEVLGEVVRVVPSASGQFILNIRYDQAPDRSALDAVLGFIFQAHGQDQARAHPRIPVNLPATNGTPYSSSYLIRDLSLGGMGIEVEASQLPRTVQIGLPFFCEITLSVGTLDLHGEIVWMTSPQIAKGKWANPAVGVTFGKLRNDTKEHLDTILQLKGLPPPPWKARLAFGMDAVSRMP